MISFLRTAWRILRNAVRELGLNDPFRMAGATAFFTTFGLPAILMIIVRTLGLFSDRRTVGRQMGRQMRHILGDESMDSIVMAIRSFRSLQQNYLLTAVIFIFLLFVATTLFKIIKNSINEIWNIRVDPGVHLLDLLKSRGISLAVILLGGLLFFGVQFVDTWLDMLSRYLERGLDDSAFFLTPVLRMAVAVIISTVWFYVLFMFMPDGRPSGRIVLGGAVITAVLFTCGKLVLGVLLSPGRVNSFYGASGALVLVLLFMFYSSLILYFGAALIKSWSDAWERPIVPKKHAIRYRTVEN